MRVIAIIYGQFFPLTHLTWHLVHGNGPVVTNNITKASDWAVLWYLDFYPLGIDELLIDIDFQ